MANKLHLPVTPPQPNEQSKLTIDLPGKLSEYLGSGKHAQTAIVYLTIRWCFIIGLIFSFVIFIAAWLGWSKFSMEDIKTIWTIFIPLITLALGYLFGKGKD